MAQIVLDRLLAEFKGGEILQTGSQHGNEWARVRRDAWIKVTTFVSQASNHLAATQLSITPQFDGSVQLTFPIRLWSEHQPRFPIASVLSSAVR